MRKTFFLLCLLCLAAASAWAQGSIVAASPPVAQAGYSGAFTITGSGTNWTRSTYGLNLKLTHIGSGTIYNFGNAPGGAGWIPASWSIPATSLTGNITLPGNAQPGSYRIEVTGFGDGGMQNNYHSNTTAFSVGANMSYFTGHVAMDRDSNCTQNGTDYGAANVVVVATPGPYYAVTNGSGDFSLTAPVATYSFTVVPPTFASIHCPASGTQPATTTAPGTTASGIDFFLKPDPNCNLIPSLVVGNHRPGFNNNGITLQVGNNSLTAAANVVVRLIKPSAFAMSLSSSIPSSAVMDTITWNAGTIAPLGSWTNHMYFTVPIGTPLGTPFIYRLEVSTSSTETTLADNVDIKSDVIVGSYDPNDKQVWVASSGAVADGHILPTDTTLRYLIRFQNTGTDTAFNIVVRDTFDVDLDMGTLAVINTSHPMNMQFADSTGRRIGFAFNNILLPDSNTNEQLSHGFVEYRIKRKNGLANGTAITNRASIYFDFNAPVVTNMVTSTICPALGNAFGHTGATQTINFTGPTSGNANSWNWNFGDGQTGTGANPSHAYAQGGTYIVCVIVSNACGRSQQICQSVTVNCSPFNALFNNNAGSGLSVNFTNTSTGPYNSVQWTFGDGGTSTTASPAHTYAAPGAYTVCLVLGNGCNQSDTACTTILVGCTALSTAFNSNVTANTATFTDMSAGTNLTYTWDFGDGGSSNLPSPTHVYGSTGSFAVCLTVHDACARSMTTCDSVTVSCLAPASAYAVAPNLLTVAFTDLSANNPTVWAWDFGDGNFSAQQNPQHTYAAAGTYAVCLTASNACASHTYCDSVTVLSTGTGPALLGSVQLLPNPANDRAMLSMVHVMLEEVSFDLRDALGRSLLHWEASTDQGSYQCSIDLGQLSNGVYFLHMQGANAQKAIRLLVQH